MQGDLYSILWEDLAEAEGRILKALSVLRELQHAVEQGQIDQPDRQDSYRLNRLMVLADLLYAETRPGRMKSRARMATGSIPRRRQRASRLCVVPPILPHAPNLQSHLAQSGRWLAAPGIRHR